MYHMLKVGKRHLYDELVARGARVVDQDCDRAERIGGLREKPCYFFLLAHVGLDGATTPSQGCYSLFSLGCGLGIAAIIDDDIRAGLRETQGGCSPDTLTTARHQCDFTC